MPLINREEYTENNLKNNGFYTEEDQVEKFSVPHNKVLDCITACIHVAHINDILGQQKNLMHVFIATMSSGLPWTGTLLWPFFPLSFVYYSLRSCILLIEFSWQSKYLHFHQQRNFVQGFRKFWMTLKNLAQMPT